MPPTPQHELVLQAAKDMLRQGLTEGTAGNISMRLDDGNVVVTPSSVDYDLMTVGDLVVVDPDGNVVEGERPPTSEKQLHLAVLRAYPDINAVIHSHPVHATMFAVAHLDLPPVIDEFLVYCGGEIRCSEYAPSGSKELGEAVVKALEGRGRPDPGQGPPRHGARRPCCPHRLGRPLARGRARGPRGRGEAVRRRLPVHADHALISPRGRAARGRSGAAPSPRRG